jgi:dephospho-CoA kinase
MRLTGTVLIGLTGGIGAGKSAVAMRLATHGAVVVDADQLAREALAPGTPGYARVVELFGTEILTPDGDLDRPALGRRVFADPEARRRLEEVVHPYVRARTAELIAAVPPGSVVVNDVPLLAEAGLAKAFDLVIVVQADEATRVRRLARTRAMSAEEAYSRIRTQASDEQRRAVADVVIVNDGSIDELHAGVDKIWTHRIAPVKDKR